MVRRFDNEESTDFKSDIPPSIGRHMPGGVAMMCRGVLQKVRDSLNCRDDDLQGDFKQALDWLAQYQEPPGPPIHHVRVGELTNCTCTLYIGSARDCPLHGDHEAHTQRT